MANYFVPTFAFGWLTNPIIANIFTALPLFEVARLLVHLDPVAGRILNGNHRTLRAAVELGIPNCVRLGIQKPTEWQRIRN